MNRALPYILIPCLAIPLAAAAALGAAPTDYDKIHLKSGTILEGCVVDESPVSLKLETLGGSISVLTSAIRGIERARPAESAMLLGLQFIERGKFERAKAFIERANGLSLWDEAREAAMQQIQAEEARVEAERIRKQEEHIERIIERQGLDAGIKALQTLGKRSQPEDDYWGNMRGRIHILMALDRLDHLDYRSAERHLNLAEQYGADPEDWNRVKEKIVAMKRQSLLHGRDFVIAQRERERKTAEPKIVTAGGQLAEKVKRAQMRGERVPPPHLVELMERHARQNGIDPLLVWAMIDTESSWRPTVVSHKGAQGLMQLMPGTARDMDVANPFDPEENIRGGTRYFKFLMSMFNDTDTALAAYNMGPGRIERSDGIPGAGREYIRKVRGRHEALRKKFG